ncbi:MAG TPA: DNA-binding protein WhiA [Syntrophomonadaceae bacterium]|nr:DNA-binding protein WhiA [Syntrophomonadaceae bacterium]HQA07149.1 DNA-binding protein WhiA [Syntrophomonadaceae bacterium]HQE23542.1 DNA-binding protein WhiA [Syntrophomonadaceae bacterium]
MSFAMQVRDELARLNAERFCCRKAELAALLVLNASLQENNGQQILVAEFENAATARKAFLLIKELYALPVSVSAEKKKRFRKTRVYLVKSKLDESCQAMLRELGLINAHGQFRPGIRWKLLNRNCCRRAYLRGAFLSRGFISRPEGNYHLEIVLHDQAMAGEVQKLMARLNLEARQTERKTSQVLYIKDAESIVDFLRTVGASKALLDFENVRILKSMRNNVNRQVNFETANLVKTVDASIRQIEAIKQIVDSHGWEGIPPGLRTLAQLRLEFPDSSLKELGEMMAPPLTKSGVAHRMRKIEDLADQIMLGE